MLNFPYGQISFWHVYRRKVTNIVSSARSNNVISHIVDSISILSVHEYANWTIERPPLIQNVKTDHYSDRRYKHTMHIKHSAPNDRFKQKPIRKLEVLDSSEKNHNKLQWVRGVNKWALRQMLQITVAGSIVVTTHFYSFTGTAG